MNEKSTTSNQKPLKSTVSMPILRRSAEQDHPLIQNHRSEADEENGDRQTTHPKNPFNKSVSSFQMSTSSNIDTLDPQRKDV